MGLTREIMESVGADKHQAKQIDSQAKTNFQLDGITAAITNNMSDGHDNDRDNDRGGDFEPEL